MKSAISTARRSLLAVAVLVAATLPAVLTNQLPASAAIQATYYVAPDGNDANPGTIAVAVQDRCNARGTSFAR